jgi:hypothetical protein
VLSEDGSDVEGKLKKRINEESMRKKGAKRKKEKKDAQKKEKVREMLREKGVDKKEIYKNSRIRFAANPLENPVKDF